MTGYTYTTTINTDHAPDVRDLVDHFLATRDDLLDATIHSANNFMLMGIDADFRSCWYSERDNIRWICHRTEKTGNMDCTWNAAQ